MSEEQGSGRDNNDGTYTASYSVAARGDYELSVEVNGSPIGGSPFPVFFSPPEPAAAEQPASASTATEQAPSMLDTAIAASSALDAALMSTANAALATQPPSVLGPQAHEAGVEFPSEAAVLDCTLLVGNLNPIVTIDQIRQLFAFCGSVTNVSLVGNNKQFALVEYATPGETAAASAMNGMQVMDRAIVVEQAAIAAKTKEKGTANPYAAIKAAHLQQVMIAQMQQAQLAAQVAAMRVQAKTNPSGVVAPGAPQNSASQKAAALSAIAALSKRLAGGGAPPSSFPAKIPERSVSPSKRPSPSPPRRRRDSSRDRRDRDRDYSRSNRARSERRDRDRDDDRKRDRRDVDRDRERGGRDRREKDRDRERRGDIGRRGDSRRGDRSERDNDRRKDREDRDGNRDGHRADSKRGHSAEGRGSSREPAKENGKAAAPAEDDAESREKQKRAEEARRLRERALEALNASATPQKTVPPEAPAPAPAAPETNDQNAAPLAENEQSGVERMERKRSRSPSPAAEVDREERRKEKPHKKHKKHKRHHRHRDREEEEPAGAAERRSDSE
ncbi:hypothetical protein WJX75_005978 [Coccomyxa subellipsoidea]|uniref:RRM domain-containing protein n=1 Tax=Coccomyxa subellipsoidea TaxID=248742 RepID=A0ABR2YHX9_9CHLO